MWTQNPLLRDAGAAVLTGGAAMAVLRLWEQVGNRALLDQVSCHYKIFLFSSRLGLMIVSICVEKIWNRSHMFLQLW
jgi:hypothetical protein